MIDILVAGGPVMVFLLLAAVLAIAYVVERVIVLARLPSHEGGAQAVADVEQVLFDQGREVAAERCKAGRGILNYIFASLIKRYDALVLQQHEYSESRSQSDAFATEAGADHAALYMAKQNDVDNMREELVFEISEASRGYLGKNLQVINTVATISPLLGLLGTIIGMIIAFQSIAVAGTGDPKVVAGGISQALVTTATGLVIAIPAIIAYRLLARRADKARDRVEIFGHAFANALIIAGLRRGDVE